MKDKIVKILKGFITPDQLAKRIVLVVVACSFMAFSASLLLLADLGTDSYTNMNQAIANYIGWTFGNWQTLINVILFILVVIFGTDNNLGFGTLANMFLIGYEVDFFSWIWSKVFPAGLFDTMGNRVALMIPALIVFIISAAVYMNAGLGTSPCDAISFIVKDRWLKKIPFTAIRMTYDFLLIAIAFVFSGRLYPVTILMALFLGAAVEYTAKLMFRRK